jgi:hypothetical protein
MTLTERLQEKEIFRLKENNDYLISIITKLKSKNEIILIDNKKLEQENIDLRDRVDLLEGEGK